jgi:hypothetical protein
MKTNHTDITIVLDRSGSMRSIASETIGGFNKFLEDQQKAPGTAVLTLNQFDDVFETPIQCKDIKQVEQLTDKTFVPRGFTALLDAIGKTVNSVGVRLDALPDSEKPSKVVIVIITDGQENASKEFRHVAIKNLIEHQRNKYSWEFVFLAANQDAIAVGSSYGVLAANAMSYASNAAGATQAFGSISKNMTAMRSCTKASMSFDDADLQAQKDAGV